MTWKRGLDARDWWLGATSTASVRGGRGEAAARLLDFLFDCGLDFGKGSVHARQFGKEGIPVSHELCAGRASVRGGVVGRMLLLMGTACLGDSCQHTAAVYPGAPPIIHWPLGYFHTLSPG